MDTTQGGDPPNGPEDGALMSDAAADPPLKEVDRAAMNGARNEADAKTNDPDNGKTGTNADAKGNGEVNGNAGSEPAANAPAEGTENVGSKAQAPADDNESARNESEEDAEAEEDVDAEPVDDPSPEDMRRLRAEAIEDLLKRVREAPPATRGGTAITDDDIELAGSLSTAELADLEAALKAAGVKTLAPFRTRLRQTRRRLATEAPNGSGNWEDRLVRSEKGLVSAPANAITILRNDPVWDGVLAWDDFSQAVVFLRPPPWFTDDAPGAATPTDEDAEMLDDAGTTRISAWLLRAYGLYLEDQQTYRAVVAVAKSRIVNCVMDWLNGLTWDGTSRIGAWLTTYLGVPPSAFARFVGQSFLISAVARASSPGCQVDTTLIFEGAQDRGKSSALRALFGRFFSETPLDLNSKDRFTNLRGIWCQSFDELASLSRAEANVVKNFLTSIFDVYRPPYGAHPVRVKRRLVFAGTINPPPGAGYLKDVTGNRRFWPVRTAEVGPIDLDALARDREQLWAEAVALYKAGAKWWPSTEAERAMCRVEQQARQETGAWDQKIERWLAGKNCEACHGLGKSPLGRDCETCTGTGVAPAKPCGVCKGTKQTAGAWCQSCKGTGKARSGPPGFPDRSRPAGDFVTLDDVLSRALDVPEERWPSCYRQVAEAMARLGWQCGPRALRGRDKVTPYYGPGATRDGFEGRGGSDADGFDDANRDDSDPDGWDRDDSEPDGLDDRDDSEPDELSDAEG
jgi:predicted P-loop ATPase